jgi:hypothetical protein
MRDPEILGAEERCGKKQRQEKEYSFHHFMRFSA